MNLLSQLFKKKDKNKMNYALLQFKEWANTENGKIFMEYLLNEYHFCGMADIGSATENALYYQGQVNVINNLLNIAYKWEKNNGK
jgi:hypothetical protein